MRLTNESDNKQKKPVQDQDRFDLQPHPFSWQMLGWLNARDFQDQAKLLYASEELLGHNLLI